MNKKKTPRELGFVGEKTNSYSDSTWVEVEVEWFFFLPCCFFVLPGFNTEKTDKSKF